MASQFTRAKRAIMARKHRYENHVYTKITMPRNPERHLNHVYVQGAINEFLARGEQIKTVNTCNDHVLKYYSHRYWTAKTADELREFTHIINRC